MRTGPVTAHFAPADATAAGNAASRPVFISTIPVLIPTGEAKPQGYALCGLRPVPVRVMTTGDLEALCRGLGEVQRDEFRAVVSLSKAFRDRDRNGAWKANWRKALSDYKLCLAIQRNLHETGRRREDDQAERELGRWLIANQGNVGIDLGTKSPKKAAAVYRGYALPRNSQSDPLLLLGRAIHRHLLLAIGNLVLWRSMGGDPQLGLLFRQREEALYVLALLWLPERKGFSVCPHPRCDKVVFVPSRPDQDYCSPAHREAHRVMRWRMTPKGKRAMKRDAERRKERRISKARQTKGSRAKKLAVKLG